MTHLSVALLVYFNENLKSYKGLPIDSRIWNFSSPEKVKDQGGGIVLGVMGAPEGLVSPVKFATQLAPGWGRSHKEFMKKHYGAHSSVFAVAEHIPKADNRVMLAGEKDSDGMQKAMVLSGMQDDDLRLLRIMKKRCGEIAGTSGGGGCGDIHLP